MKTIYTIYGEHYSIVNNDKDYEELSCDQYHIEMESFEDDDEDMMFVKDSMWIEEDVFFTFDDDDDANLYSEWLKNGDDMEYGFTNGLWNVEEFDNLKDASARMKELYSDNTTKRWYS